VTDRRYASSLAVVTGQEDPGKKDKMDYGAIGADTVVVLMGVGNLEKIVKQMLQRRSKSTPVAIIEEGTTERQRVITSTLGEVVEKARAARVRPPAVIVIGEVVRLRRELSRSG
jgi:siroheme synthase